MVDVVTETQLLTTFSGGEPFQIAMQNLVHTLFTVAATVSGPMNYKGVIDCSANPNYPAAAAGDMYRTSVAGKIGGASGTSVDAGDLILAIAANVGGTQAAVGASWSTVEHNLLGALLSANDLSDVASAATARTNLGLAIGTNVQAYDADLTTWAGIIPDTNVATFLATPSSANLAATLTDETGTGAAVFANTPTLVTPEIDAATGTSVVLSSFTKVTPVAVASLPAAATAGMGARAFVNDALTTVILGLGTTVANGGANKVPVYSDGTNWIYG